MESGAVQVGGGASTPSRPSPSAEDGRTRHRVTALLLEHGPQTATELAGRLGVSPTAVRRHLDALVATGRGDRAARTRCATQGTRRPALWCQGTGGTCPRG